MKVMVRINGTDKNPWHKMGLKANPFPQIPKAEYDALNHVLRLLDSDPIPDLIKLQMILENVAEAYGVNKNDPAYQKFVEACTTEYRQGERVSFTITFPG